MTSIFIYLKLLSLKKIHIFSFKLSISMIKIKNKIFQRRKNQAAMTIGDLKQVI